MFGSMPGYEERDPVVRAIELNQEKIAVYLIEKYFSFNNTYYKPGEECEPWCYALHVGKPCPSQYDALKLAEEKNMSFIEKLMGEIRSGTRVPGETLKSNRRVSVDSLTEFAEKKWSLKEANFKRQFSTMDKYEKFAAELEDKIINGQLGEIRKCLDPIVQIEEVETILEAFGDRDPVIRAIDCQQEKIACYLVEKNFPTHIYYDNPGFECDEWCYSLHEGSPCPNQFTALDLAKRKKMTLLANLIENIHSGKWKPGDGLKLERRVSMDRLPPLHESLKIPSAETKMAKKLEDLLTLGDLMAVKELLSPVTSPEVIGTLVRDFEECDPVTYAVDHMQEDVACYLVGKGFPFDLKYNYPGQECDQWCYALHKGSRCPAVYDAMQMAQERDLKKVCRLMEDKKAS
ncbi:uncharacterized protein LOC135491998 [Lineus longissimus]|uniref:uncharacterized protein LOC135491998 n=1 Tax=Lineus longissimus TaxID=88925 RepID=UPI002B4F17AF